MDESEEEMISSQVGGEEITASHAAPMPSQQATVQYAQPLFGSHITLFH